MNRKIIIGILVCFFVVFAASLVYATTWGGFGVAIRIQATGLTDGAVVYNATPAFRFNITNATGVGDISDNTSANCTLYADTTAADLARITNLTGVQNNTDYTLRPSVGGPTVPPQLAEGLVHWYINCTQWNASGADVTLIAVNSTSTPIQSFYLKTIGLDLFTATDGTTTLDNSEGDFNGTNGAAGAGFLNATNITRLVVNISAYNTSGVLEDANITEVRIYYNSTGGVPTVNYMAVMNISTARNDTHVIFYNNTLAEFIGPLRLTTDGAVLSFMIWVKTNSSRQVNFTNSGKYYNITIDGAAPTVTPSVTPTTGTSLTTAYALSCTYSDTVDTSLTYDAMQVIKPSGAIVNPTSLTFTDTGEAGTYTLRCGATDDTSRHTISSTTFTVSAVSSTTSSGGGGGSSGAATVSSTVGVDSIAAGGVAQFETAASKVEAIGVTGVDIAVINSASNVVLKVEQVNTKPSTITANVDGDLYKYVLITVSNVATNNIDTATVKFKVSKSWLTENGFDKADVRLNRWAVEWTSYAAAILSEDDQYVYYSANVPGFSYFAISAKNGTAGGETGATADENAAGTGTETNTSPPAAESKSSTWAWILGIVVLAGIVFAVYYILKKR